MPMSLNKMMLTTVAEGLADLLPDMVFVGGAVVELYIPDDVEIAEVRQTEDVDCVAAITGRNNFTELEERLRKLGFQHEKNIICRWVYKDVIVDVMPTDEKVLGFSNRWYREGITHAISHHLSDRTVINILPVTWFIACKIEALLGRGITDLRLSKDLEDIVFLLNYLVGLEDEIAMADYPVKKYIQKNFQALLKYDVLPEAIFCVLPAGENNPQKAKLILQKIQAIINMV